MRFSIAFVQSVGIHRLYQTTDARNNSFDQILCDTAFDLNEDETVKMLSLSLSLLACYSHCSHHSLRCQSLSLSLSLFPSFTHTVLSCLLSDLLSTTIFVNFSFTHYFYVLSSITLATHVIFSTNLSVSLRQ